MDIFHSAYVIQDDAMARMSRAWSNFEKLGQDKMTLDNAKQRLAQLKAQYAGIEQNHKQLILASSVDNRESHIYFVEDQYQTCYDSFIEMVTCFNDHISSLSPNPPMMNSTNLDQTSFYPNQSQFMTPSRFPRIEIPKFNGNALTWESFNDQFTSLVISDASLPNVTKLHYLHAALTGTAKQVIQHLQLTDANFPIAWDLVKSRYSNLQLIITTHLKTLFSLPKVSPDSAESLQTLVDTVTATLRALEPHECHVDQLSSCMLVHLITERLDSATVMCWAQYNSQSKKFPSYSDLHAFLTSRIHMLLALSPINRHKIIEKPRKLTTHSTQVETTQCLACDSKHLLIHCPTFQAWSVQQRIDHLRRLGRCLRCFRKHTEAVCKRNRQCQGCKSWHHSLTHVCPSSSKTATTPSVAIAMHTSMQCRSPSILLATATVKVYTTDRSLCVRALLDQGSEASFISENLAQLLRVTRTSCPFIISVMGPTNTTARHTTRIGISAISHCTSTVHAEAIILPVLSKYIPNRGAPAALCARFKKLKLADRNLHAKAPIDLLIGADLYNEVMLPGLIKSTSSGPLAQRTIFGWVLSGQHHPPGPSLTVHSHHITVNDLSQQLHKFWEVETVPVASTVTPEEKACEEHFQATHSRTANGRFMVRLPFRFQTTSPLGDCKRTALRSLLRLEQRLQLNADKAKAYLQFMTEYESLGHMQRVNATEACDTLRSYFIPHHAVFKSDVGAVPPRLRMVFNASACSSNGVSLNCNLHVGPKLQQDFPATILRWRQYPFVITADVKMYRQILMHPDDTPFQQILWRTSPQEAVDVYRLCTVTYGTACAPFLALRCLKQLAMQDGCNYPLAQHTLLHQTYVDDCIMGAYSHSETCDTRDQLIKLLAGAQMELSKWTSNDETLLPSPPSIETSSPKDLKGSDEQSILGIRWLPIQDQFSFTFVPMESTMYTKRVLLSQIARIFDLLGWIAPVVASTKIMMQQLWKCPIGWDDPLPPPVIGQWNAISQHFHLLPTMPIPRWIGCLRSDQAVELHGFADASTSAYAAVVYLRLPSPDPGFAVSLMMSRTKVAPLNTISIPRLELCAVLLLSHLIDYVRQSLQFSECAIHCWSDSMVALSWIDQPSYKWRTFVANRVAKFQSFGHPWHYVSTRDNPADCASRGLLVPELRDHPLWWSGPSWLQLPPSAWPSQASVDSSGCAVEARTPIVSCGTLSHSNSGDFPLKYSSWQQLLRISAYFLRFLYNLRHPQSRCCTPFLSSSELRLAHDRLIGYIQRELFPNELQSLHKSGRVSAKSPIASLCPYLDADGLIRALGRLQHSALSASSIYPLILRRHLLVDLIVRDAHHRLLHGGPFMGSAHLRLRYWKVRSKAVIRQVLYQCVACTRERAATATELMGNLPPCSVQLSTRPFMHTGVDYAGPLFPELPPVVA